MKVVVKTDITAYPLLSRGKVRDIYDVDEKTLLIVTTDRMSAFDVIMSEPIPYKGVILNKITLFWMDKFKDIIPNHLLESDVNRFPAALDPWKDELEGRAVLVRKAKPLPVECIVRGYITGSGWKDYQATGQLCGYRLPEGLRESDKLEPALFTPSTKAELGQHDENISVAEAARARTRPAWRKRPPWPFTRPGGPMPPGAASSWRTPNLNSASLTAACTSSTKCSPPTPRVSGPLTSTRPDRASPASTSSICATGSRNSPGICSRPRRTCPKRSSGPRRNATRKPTRF